MMIQDNNQGLLSNQNEGIVLACDELNCGG